MPEWSELPLVKPVLKKRLQDLYASFPEYLDVFSRRGPFSEAQLCNHLMALRHRARFASAAEAVSNAEFADVVREVLGSWGIGTRGSELVPPEDFRAEFAKLAPRLACLERQRIDDGAIDPRQLAFTLWGLINSMGLVKRDGRPVKNRLVSGTKALHHVFPMLVFPVDREYTQTFFGWRNPEFQNNPRDCFTVIFVGIADLAKRLKLGDLVGEGWLSSPTKLLDNAIVGYCIKHGLTSDSARYQKLKRAKHQAMVKRAKEIGIWADIEAAAAIRADGIGTRERES